MRNVAGWAGSLVLLATALFHLTGLGDAQAIASELDGPAFFADALPALWLFPAVHWFAFALTAILMLRSRSPIARWAMAGIAVLVFVDALTILLSVGLFIGAFMLIAAAALLAMAAPMRAPDA